MGEFIGRNYRFALESGIGKADDGEENAKSGFRLVTPGLCAAGGNPSSEQHWVFEPDEHGGAHPFAFEAGIAFQFCQCPEGVLARFDNLAAAAAAFFEGSGFVQGAQRAEGPFEGLERLLAHAFDEGSERNTGVAQQVAEACGGDGGDVEADLLEKLLTYEAGPFFRQPLPEPICRAGAPSHAGRMPQRGRGRPACR